MPKMNLLASKLLVLQTLQLDHQCFQMGKNLMGLGV